MYKVTFFDHLATPLVRTLSAMNDDSARKEAWNLYMINGKEKYMENGFKSDFSKGYEVSDPDGRVFHHFYAGVEAA